MFKNLLAFNVLLLGILLCNCAVFFTTNSEYGIFAAISFPISLSHRNVFFSYNFEANFYFASNWIVPPILSGGVIHDVDVYNPRQSQDYCPNCTALNEDDIKTGKITDSNDLPLMKSVHNTTQSPQRTLLTRTDFYQILIDKFNRSGLKGESCLLRLICELNASELGDVNGVLGSIFRVILAPSTSAKEPLLHSYYEAEVQGKKQGSCLQYTKDCGESILDMISSPITDIFSDLVNNIL